jgi:uncharacterized MAPEG superfamily protein
MSVAYWCIVVAALLPYLTLGTTVFPSKSVATRGGPGYDNHDPRASAEKLVGWRKRATNAQLNSFEAFPAFAAAVLMAEHLHGSSAGINAWALAFIGCRVVYCGLYLGNFATLRSTVWFLGLTCVLALFAIAAGF